MFLAPHPRVASTGREPDLSQRGVQIERVRLAEVEAEDVGALLAAAGWRAARVLSAVAPAHAAGQGGDLAA